MKTKKLIYILTLAVLTVTSLTSCSKDKEEDTPKEPEPPQKTLVEQIEAVNYSATNPEEFIVIDGTNPVTVTYDVKPVGLAPQLAEQKELLSLTGIDLPATLTITDVKGNANNELSLTLAPAGFEQDKSYRVALVIKDEKTAYTTSFTDIFVKQNVDIDPDEVPQDKAETR